jgi:stalled ribosome rescue protein Dom34
MRLNMEDYKEKYDDLIKRGFTIDFHEEDRNYPMTGPYHAFCVTIKKNDKIIKEGFSKTSHEHALILAHRSMEITRDLHI